jgi:hypothetical protein
MSEEERDEICCANCKYRYDLKKADYSDGHCVDTEMPGYICMALDFEGIAVWMYGANEKNAKCEYFAPKDGVLEK